MDEQDLKRYGLEKKMNSTWEIIVACWIFIKKKTKKNVYNKHFYKYLWLNCEFRLMREFHNFISMKL